MAKYPKFVSKEFEEYYDSMCEEGFSNSYIKGRIEIKKFLRKEQPEVAKRHVKKEKEV